ncbi:ABC transporter [Oleispira antarctica]|uniref:ABC transporter n=1 Tax=Oleispira antarctica TaxID=188908 RepID=A0A1Y5HGF7_OLEAN|nr:ABC transporter [Oleispira antarctica]
MSAMIECINLSKSYGNKKALKNINFEIQSGQPIALVGPNGAGKSTLFGLLSGYMAATSGEARIFGHKVGSPELIGRIGALPQDALFDPNLTLLQQLSYLARLQGYSRSASQKEALRVLELMQLTDVHKEKITALSHGMKKRVAIAQALMGTPELVLLDEPTAGLDPENARNIRQQITELAGETTFIVSSHNLSELERMCSQVMHLEQGELKALQAIGMSDDKTLQSLDYLTLRLQQKDSEIHNKIKRLNSVQDVSIKHEDEFIIAYDRSSNITLDQDLLKLLAAESVAYRQIIQGQSLEDQLFMKTNN